MSTAIIAAPQSSSLSITETRKSVVQMVEQRNAIIEALQRVMKVDVDYGIIPGTPKPTLYKPGSEKILSMFHLAVSPTVEDLSTPDCIRYRVQVTIIHAPTGNVLGTGIGEASSAESKYQWRAVVCDEEWNATPEDRRREKWKKGGNSAYAVRQIRADMEDVANTILKMAKKRAQIDATLTCTAASDMFSQDLEDLKDAGLDPQMGETTTTPVAVEHPELQRKPEAAAPQQTTQAASGGATITEDQGKRFWAVAIKRTNDYKAIMEYLKSVHGVTKKNFILASRLAEAMAWAEGR